LRQAGYATAHFGKWDMRYDNFTPSDAGYGESDGVTGNDTPSRANAPALNRTLTSWKGCCGEQTDPKLTFSVANRTRRFIESAAAAARPFFVQASFYAVHLGFSHTAQSLAWARGQPPGRVHTSAPFAAMVLDLDVAVGMVMQMVDAIAEPARQGIYRVFFSSDNGGRASLRVKRIRSHEDARREIPQNHPLRGGKGSVYEGGACPSLPLGRA
jgi:arylsulfatase A-like enzyme